MEHSARNISRLDSMGTPLVTVIIPTHNRAESLRKALDSVYAQEAAGAQFEMEIIVVDDASTDATPDLLLQYPAVRFIRLETNRGASAARNIGIKAGRGAYVAFLDDDDLWLPHKLRRQLAVLEAHHEVGVAYSPCVIRFPDQTQALSADDDAPTGSIFSALLLGNPCGSPICVLVRREAFETVGYFDESLPTAEDYDLFLRLAFRFPFIFVPGAVAICRRSLQGKYSVHLVRGDSGCSVRYLVEKAVVERALALLPDTIISAHLRQEARANLEVRMAFALGEIGELKLMRAHALAALARCPWGLQYGWVRVAIARMARRLATASDSPIATTEAFCNELKALAGKQRIKNWVRARQTLGRVWADVGAGLVSDRQYTAAGYAVACAILQNPVLIPRKATLWLVSQIFLGSFRQAWVRVCLWPSRNR